MQFTFDALSVFDPLRDLNFMILINPSLAISLPLYYILNTSVAFMLAYIVFNTDVDTFSTSEIQFPFGFLLMF